MNNTQDYVEYSSWVLYCTVSDSGIQSTILNNYMPHLENFGLRTEDISWRLDLISTCNLALMTNSCLTGFAIHWHH